MPQLKLYMIMRDDKPYKWAPDPIKALSIIKLDQQTDLSRGRYQFSIVEWDYDKTFDDPKNLVRHMETNDHD